MSTALPAPKPAAKGGPRRKAGSVGQNFGLASKHKTAPTTAPAPPSSKTGDSKVNASLSNGTTPTSTAGAAGTAAGPSAPIKFAAPPRLAGGPAAPPSTFASLAALKSRQANDGADQSSSSSNNSNNNNDGGGGKNRTKNGAKSSSGGLLGGVGKFTGLLLRGSRSQQAQVKYEIPDELRAEFEKARKEQQRLVKQAMDEKKARVREEERQERERRRTEEGEGAEYGRSSWELGAAGGQSSGEVAGAMEQSLAGESDPRFASFFTDERVEELVQYAIYLGVDLEQQPDLVHLIRDLYYAPLPEGWTAHKTTNECSFGGG